MISSTQPLSPLRQRMLEDMRMRKLEPRTQEAYIRAVRKLAAYLQRSPDAATVEDLRNFQLHLVDTGSSPVTLHATLTGLKFFFDITLGRIELMAKMQPVKLPRTLPVVLSCEEVSHLLAAARNFKHQVALSVAYGAGLRASEVVSLTVTDIDSQRMTLRVEQGKGAKDRYAMLSPVSLLLNRWVFRTSAMRPLKRSTMPLVLGVLGLVSRCSMSRAWHSRSNSWLPLGLRLANRRSVNFLPLSVKSLLILIGQALCRALRKAGALAALLLALMATNTQRVARSMATNR